MRRRPTRAQECVLRVLQTGAGGYHSLGCGLADSSCHGNAELCCCAVASRRVEGGVHCRPSLDHACTTEKSDQAALRAFHRSSELRIDALSMGHNRWATIRACTGSMHVKVEACFIVMIGVQGCPTNTHATDKGGREPER